MAPLDGKRNDIRVPTHVLINNLIIAWQRYKESLFSYIYFESGIESKCRITNNRQPNNVVWKSCFYPKITDISKGFLFTFFVPCYGSNTDKQHKNNTHTMFI